MFESCQPGEVIDNLKMKCNPVIDLLEATFIYSPAKMFKDQEFDSLKKDSQILLYLIYAWEQVGRIDTQVYDTFEISKY